MPDERRVLVLESGSESGLEAIRTLDTGLGVAIPVDSDPWALSSWHQNFQVVPSGEDLGFLTRLAEICRAHRVTHIIPTVYHGAEYLATNARELPHLMLLLSPPEVHKLANDKAAFVRLYPQITGIAVTAHAWSPETPFAKPRHGKGSRGVFLAERASDVAERGAGVDAYVFQEYLPGPQYTVDVLTHPGSGEPLHACARRVDKLVRGTDAVAEVLPGHPLEERALDLAYALGVYGVCNFEFREDEAGQPKCIDFNCRLSASHGISAMAGFDVLSELLRLADGGCIRRRYQHNHIWAYRSLRTLWRAA